PIAAHVFERPGTYTVTLTATNPIGTTWVRRATITVLDPNAVYPGTKTVCISLTSDYTGCPAGAARQQTMPSRSAWNGKRVLFKRGQNFSALGKVDIQDGSHGVIVGAFGTGAAPEIGSVGVGDWRPETDDFASDIVVATVAHAGTLAPGESYLGEVAVTLPRVASGGYFVIVVSDADARLAERNRSNNRDSAALHVQPAPSADLSVHVVDAPADARSGEGLSIAWEVVNLGNATTNGGQWNDRIVLSTDARLSSDDIVAGSLVHSGALAAGQGYRGQATLNLPRDLEGDYFVIVESNADGSVNEGGRSSNNTAASAAAVRISLTPTPDLTISDVLGPSALRPGDVASVSYTLSNVGAAPTSGAWRDRIFVEDSSGALREMASVLNTGVLAAGSRAARSASFTLPASLPDGQWRWMVKADSDDSVYERGGENNNLARADDTLRVARVDLAVSLLDAATQVASGTPLHVEWRVRNDGGVALGSWTDQLFLAAADASAPLHRLAEIVHLGPLETGASYDMAVDVVVPLDFSGAHDLIVISDAGDAIGDGERSNNRTHAPLRVELSPYADLAVSEVSAPQTLIADPATLSVAWTVSNRGTGAGGTSSWNDRIVLSGDDVLGNADDLLIGEYRHDGALAAGESYTRSESIQLAARSSGRFRLFVVSDAHDEVFENHVEANNVALLAHPVDVMPVAYADLQVVSLATAGLAASGRSLTLSWEVVNNGIGSTDSAEWSDQVWLSRNADGSDLVAQLGQARHFGQLAVGARYARSVEVRLPEGISGTHYLNVRTGGPFEFVFTDNNSGRSPALAVELSRSPDLRVDSVVGPASAQEGALIDVSWNVVNQGDADANGVWIDSVWLLPASATGQSGAVDGMAGAIALGSFSHDGTLAAGTRYTRSEQLRLPTRIEGLYRLEVRTNARLGESGEQIYEHGAAGRNNALLAAETTAVGRNARADLRVASVIVPEHVSAGTTTAIRFTISNLGAAPANGRWSDKVYLSDDGTLSGDDRLLGEVANAGALAPGESYSSEAALLDIPIRLRGDAYLIVVADGNFRIDEYPNDSNNAYATRFTVDAVPFGDLVTSDVVAPSQAVHGAGIEVRYQVSNLGSATTRGESAALDSWTDSVWLARDKRRPGAHKGDILLGSFSHVGHLGVGESYLGDVRVTIPDALPSGEYFLSVWSDTYDVILEDTLATHINADDPTQVDNNNYHARPISVLGSAPPDLRVSEVVAPPAVTVGESYRFSYSVDNRGDAFSGSWTDSVYLADNADWNAASEVWHLADIGQTRSLGFGERYSVSQTLQLAPWINGRFLIVRTDSGSHIAEADESNNARASASQLDASAADLRVSDVRALPDSADDASDALHLSGEETTVTWTVTNAGAAVWSGTRSWADTLYLSRDPSFIAERAIALGSVVHANVGGLAAGASYTGTARLRLPAGADGQYYLYVITDAESDLANPGMRRARAELSAGGSLAGSMAWYSGVNGKPGSVFEGRRNDNNVGRGTLAIAYREPDLQIDDIVIGRAEGEGEILSGQALTISWTVSNRGSRETRRSSWVDGVYLSRDASLDYGDLALQTYAVQLQGDGLAPTLRPGESYRASITTTLPESISGDFYLLVNTDTAIFANPYSTETSSIRDDLLPLGRFGDPGGTIREFADEGNNLASTALSITLATPPDLQLAEVVAAQTVIAGQDFNVGYRVVNVGGDTPADQGRWYDLIYLSRDRFLDIDEDHYLGYVEHSGGLAAGGSYAANLVVSAPQQMHGPWYVFVISDPARAWGGGEFGRLREFGGERNNALAAAQPLLIEIPPPADLVVTQVVVPASASVGDTLRIDFSVANQSSNPAWGRWTDAVYLSADNQWDLGDLLLGKVDHVSDPAGLAANGSYDGTLTATLPPLKEGNWRLIVRPDLYNEVFEGAISGPGTGAEGMNLPPGEANNRSASGSSVQVGVPRMQVGTPLQTTLSPGQERLYKVAVAAGETLRVSLTASADDGHNELYLRYGDVPSGYAFDAAYDRPLASDQEVWLPSTQAGDYYLLLRSRQAAANTPVTLRADLLPLSITRISPDQGGSGDPGDNAHRWLSIDIEGAHFKPGALVKLTRPGVHELEPERWQVLDATRIRAVFDLRGVPLGLYDLSVINPDGQRVVEAQRFLVERGIEADVTIGIGGPRTLTPGDNGRYSVALQSLANVDTPYVRFDLGVPEMGYSDEVLSGIALPYLVVGSNIGGRPDGVSVDAAGNTQSYGPTPSSGTTRPDIPWASLDGTLNTGGVNLLPGYVVDLAAGGYVGMSFNVQTWPGLAEWIAYDFDGLRDKLYALHPQWKEQGLLDGGVQDLDRIAEGLARKFVSTVADEHLLKIERLALPFRFDVSGAATPLTRDEFVAEQVAHASRLRAAILADERAPASLAALAADPGQWVAGWLGALEAGGLLRPVDEAPPIRSHPKVVSLNSTLASGILLARGGDAYRTQGDLLGFFATVQKWYGDSAAFAGDPQATTAPVDYREVRQSLAGFVEIPVPVSAERADYDRQAAQKTHFINFNVFAGGLGELEYLRHVGVLDADFRPVPGQALDLTHYLQQAASESAAAAALLRVRGPQALLGDDGQAWVPAATALPYAVDFRMPGNAPAGQLRLVMALDASLDARSFRLGDLKLGDINVHLPAGRASFQGDFDFSGSKGFVLRVSAGIDVTTRIATWLLQAIDPQTGEVLHDATRGLLARAAGEA
ncbi:MAG: hypothetical protein J5W83_15990, partial [Candidatus Accumulibacter sp.]|uniref:CARDB domain-containing protein n=1 Tax=Accumulibacter sp. TaxID=2053492 RepID=UPI001B28CC86